MLIINADDFGANRQTTERIIDCFVQGRVTSTSAMVFMADSQRASELWTEHRIDVGLHLNFTQKLTQPTKNDLFSDYHNRIATFLNAREHNFMIYNPTLRKQFKYVFQVQLEEFERLFGILPSHIDGHHHMHICANMLFEQLIPNGNKVRKNFSYFRGEKSLPNRRYRLFIDKLLARRYLLTDYLFSLPEQIKFGKLNRVFYMSKTSSVELETHPEVEEDFRYLMSDTCLQSLSGIPIINFSQLRASNYSGDKLLSKNE